MLYEFLAANQDELIQRCRAKVAKRSTPLPTKEELTHGIPVFLRQITKTLRMEEASDEAGSQKVSGAHNPTKTPTSTEIGETAAEHGGELHRLGFTIDQVVHDYGDLCQSIVELAVERAAPITTAEFRTLNRCLDNAIADAVTRFDTSRAVAIRDQASRDAQERLGALAHELRGKLNVARLAVEAIKRGTVGIAGATGAVLDQSLLAMRDIIDRSFAEVRLGSGLPQDRERILVAGLFEQVQIFAGMEASAKGQGLTVRSGEPGVAVEADRHTISSALSNLLQNAVKFTPTGGHISLTVQVSANRVLIEVADQCGGLSQAGSDRLFDPFTQHHRDRSGLGLGLSISRRGVEANGGTLTVRNRPGTGCVFTIDLPKYLS